MLAGVAHAVRMTCISMDRITTQSMHALSRLGHQALPQKQALQHGLLYAAAINSLCCMQVSESDEKPVNQGEVSLGGGKWPELVKECIIGALNTKMISKEDQIVSLYHRCRFPPVLQQWCYTPLSWATGNFGNHWCPWTAFLQAQLFCPCALTLQIHAASHMDKSERRHACPGRVQTMCSNKFEIRLLETRALRRGTQARWCLRPPYMLLGSSRALCLP